ncbi:hypothetical protein MSPP1_000398 [Malassezia sp. CBS 17886]|nr:hypothetical protein MSPP1_000398 [Malassezia sp. CBS 17886]
MGTDEPSTSAALITRGVPIVPPSIGERSLRRQVVLDEDDYTDGLARILQRDFFPQLPRLRAQNAYLAALDDGDDDAIYHTARALVRVEEQCGILEEATFRGDQGEPLTPLDVPNLAQTPSHGYAQSDAERTPHTAGATPAARPGVATPEPRMHAPPQQPAQLSVAMTLDEYQARYTSEDNASFAQLMQVAKDRRRAQHSWAYAAADAASAKRQRRDASARDEAQDGARLALRRAGEGGAARSGGGMGGAAVRTSSRAALDVPAVGPHAPRVQHANTRLLDMIREDAMSSSPHTPSTPSSSVMDEAIRGVPDTPKVAGYGFVDPEETPQALRGRRLRQLARGRSWGDGSWKGDAVEGGNSDTLRDTHSDTLPSAKGADAPSSRVPRHGSLVPPRRTAAVGSRRPAAHALSPAASSLLQRTTGRTPLRMHTRRSDATPATQREAAADAAHRRHVGEQRWASSPVARR